MSTLARAQLSMLHCLVGGHVGKVIVLILKRDLYGYPFYVESQNPCLVDHLINLSMLETFKTLSLKLEQLPLYITTNTESINSQMSLICILSYINDIVLQKKWEFTISYMKMSKVKEKIDSYRYGNKHNTHNILSLRIDSVLTYSINTRSGLSEFEFSNTHFIWSQQNRCKWSAIRTRSSIRKKCKFKLPSACISF